MKNKEKYANEIIDIALNNGTITLDKNRNIMLCNTGNCNKCLFKQINCEYSCNKIKEWANEEYVEPILTDKEKEYLNSVIKPFKDRVQYIEKTGLKYYFISIILTSVEDGKYDNYDLPYFEKDTMYKNMKVGNKYTLKELGLEE